jgi:glycosyltransferase involved in cell wall biosynthesis
MYVPARKIVRLGMGVDTDRFSPAPRDEELLQKLDLDPADFVFLYVGRLAPEKGLPSLIEAFQSLQLPDCRLLLIGSGPEKPNLNLSRTVMLIPSVSYSEVHRWHRLADAFVYPSRPTVSAEEQFGYSLVEAMSTEKAVIATRVGGMPDVVGEAGILVAPDNVPALASAMLQVYRDGNLRLQLGKAARTRVLERYSTTVVSARLAEIYDKCARG